MKKIIIIAKKEFLDMFRDKRTLMRMILIPLLAFPLIMYLITTLQLAQSKKEAEKTLEIGYYLNGQSEKYIEKMDTAANYTFTLYSDSVQMQKDVKSDSINLAILFSANFDSNYQKGKQASYSLYYRQADNEEFDRFQKLLDLRDEDLVQERLKSQNLPVNYAQPVQRNLLNQSEVKEVIGKYAGGILPYIFLAFCFMGCMLPAIDLFAGEKERGTIETLLASPVNRVHLLVGKMIVVAAFGLISASVVLIGLFVSLNFMADGNGLMVEVNKILSPQLIITLYLLLIPVAIFFAGIMIPVSVYARSFKEAQSILTPLNMAVILPAMIGFLPGFELDYVTAFIPIVNIVLATKAMIAGTAPLVPLIITFTSLILLSAVAVFISFKQFGKETNILR